MGSKIDQTWSATSVLRKAGIDSVRIQELERMPPGLGTYFYSSVTGSCTAEGTHAYEPLRASLAALFSGDGTRSVHAAYL